VLFTEEINSRSQSARNLSLPSRDDRFESEAQIPWPQTEASLNCGLHSHQAHHTITGLKKLRRRRTFDSMRTHVTAHCKRSLHAFVSLAVHSPSSGILVYCMVNGRSGCKENLLYQPLTRSSENPQSRVCGCYPNERVQLQHMPPKSLKSVFGGAQKGPRPKLCAL
jgi:hypothetical protein